MAKTADEVVEEIYRDLMTQADIHSRRGNSEKAELLRYAAAVVLHSHSDPNGIAARVSAST